MTDSVYRKTPLPVRLNLSDRNTKDQLTTGVAEKENGRGALEGVGLANSASSQSQKNCTDVMRKDLQDWLKTSDLEGAPVPNSEAEQRAMWTWMRDFHKEYNDDWFARNMPRLHKQFRPVFLEEMKRMRAESAAAAKEATQQAAPPPVDDLLDFGSSAAAPAAAPSGDNLLDMGPAAPPPAVAAETNGSAIGLAAAAPPVQASAANTGDLLDFDLGGPSPPLAAAAPAPASAPPKNGDLLDLMF